MRRASSLILLPLFLGISVQSVWAGIDDAAPQLARVHKDSHDVAAWVSFIQAVRNDDSPYLRWVTTRALELNPNSAEILLRAGRAAPFHDPAFAAQQFRQLARIPGYEQLSADSLEWIYLGLPVEQAPSAVRDGEWASRLITIKKMDRAAAVLTAAVLKYPGDKTLAALDAMQLALGNQFDAALARQRSAGFPQLQVGPYLGLADVLLLADKPAEAVESYGNVAPTTPQSRRLLAWALQRARLPDRGRAALANQTDREDLLLRYVIESENDNAAGARAIAEQLVTPLEFHQGSQSGVARLGVTEAVALRPPLNRAFKDLAADFPAKRAEIQQLIGVTVPDPYIPWHAVEPDPPAAAALPRATDQLARAQSAEEKRNAWFALSAAHQLAGNDDASLAAMATAVFSDELWPNEKQRQRNAQIQWTLLLRRVEGERLFRAKPDELLAAEPSYASLRIFPGSREDELRTMSSADTVKNLSAFGPGILAALYPTSGISAIGPHRREYLAIITNVGSLADVPVLYDTLQLLGRHAKDYAELPVNDSNKRSEAENLVEFKLLNACLISLTHQSPPDGAIPATVTFWQNYLDHLGPTLKEMRPADPPK